MLNKEIARKMPRSTILIGWTVLFHLALSSAHYDVIQATNTGVERADGIRRSDGFFVTRTDDSTRTDASGGTRADNLRKTDDIKSTDEFTRSDAIKSTDEVTRTDDIRKIGAEDNTRIDEYEDIRSDGLRKTEDMRKTNAIKRTDDIRRIDDFIRSHSTAIRGTDYVGIIDDFVRSHDTVDRKADDTNRSDDIRRTDGIRRSDGFRRTDNIRRSDDIRRTDDIRRFDIRRTDDVRRTDDIRRPDDTGILRPNKLRINDDVTKVSHSSNVEPSSNIQSTNATDRHTYYLLDIIENGQDLLRRLDIQMHYLGTRLKPRGYRYTKGNTQTSQGTTNPGTQNHSYRNRSKIPDASKNSRQDHRNRLSSKTNDQTDTEILQTVNQDKSGRFTNTKFNSNHFSDSTTQSVVSRPLESQLDSSDTGKYQPTTEAPEHFSKVQTTHPPVLPDSKTQTTHFPLLPDSKSVSQTRTVQPPPTCPVGYSWSSAWCRIVYYKEETSTKSPGQSSGGGGGALIAVADFVKSKKTPPSCPVGFKWFENKCRAVYQNKTQDAPGQPGTFGGEGGAILDIGDFVVVKKGPVKKTPPSCPAGYKWFENRCRAVYRHISRRRM